MTEWIELPLNKMENIKDIRMKSKFVRYLGIKDEFHLRHIVFEIVMGHPWENVDK